MERASHGFYHDPLDLVWIRCAERLGMKVVRSREVYASWDGRATLSVAAREDFDPDDSVAQLVLHEICHALVQGPAGQRRVDWGLDNTDDAASAVQEHACHRLQAALLDTYGLRDLLAVTTTWRPYWDALPSDPLSGDDDPAVPLARRAFADAVRGPWSGPLAEALRATADLADLVRPHAPADSLWARTVPRNPLGLASRGAGVCGTCAWASGTPLRCLSAAEPDEDGPRIQPEWPACYRWEPRLDDDDCRTCGACCREAFQVVGVEPDEPLADLRPDWLEDGFLPRPDGRCVALEGRPGCWTCAVYAIRPRACAEFESGGEHCLTARRAVGRSRV